MSRPGKWYRRNEADVMRSLGFKPTPNSGSGWVAKEDGENEYALCQLKSTDADSIRIQRRDLHTLEYNAAISHKMPVFAIQFIQGNETWLMVKPEDLGALQAIAGVCGGNVAVNPTYKPMFGMTKGNTEVMGGAGQSSELMKEKMPVITELLETQRGRELNSMVESSREARERFRQEVEATHKKKERKAT